MDLDLYNKGELDIDFVNGELIIQVGSKGGSIMAKADAGYFLDKLAEKIPGEIDDKIIAMLKAAAGA